MKTITSLRKPVNTSPLIRINNLNQVQSAKGNKDKAIAFTEHLTDVFSEHDDENTQKLDLLNNRTDLIVYIKSIIPKEIRYEIRRKKIKKSPGMNPKTAKMLKELPQNDIVCVIFTQCYRSFAMLI